MRRPLCALVLVSLALAANARADEGSAPAKESIELTLEEAVALALRENYDIRNAYLQRIRDKFALLVAHDKFVPHYNTTVGVGNLWQHGPSAMQTQSGNIVSLAPHAELILPTGATVAADLAYNLSRPPTFSQGDNAASFALTLTQPLLKNFGFEVNAASVVIGDMQEHVNQLTLKQQLINSISAVIFAYRDLSQAKLLLDIARKAVSRSRDLLDINHQMVAAGRMAPADLIQTESEIATREVNQVNAEGDYIGYQVTLLELLALTEGADVLPVPETVPANVAPSVAEAHSQALANRPEYLTNVVNRDIAVKNLLLSENNRSWSLDLTAQHIRGGATGAFGQSLADIGIGPSNSTAIGLLLTVPLFHLELQQSVVNSEVTLRQAEVSIAQIRNNVTLEVDAAWRSLDLRRRRYELATRARELSEKTLNNEREKLAAGRSSNFQVLRFVDDLVNAEIAEIQARITYLNAVTTFRIKIGSLLEAWEVPIK